MHPFWKAVVRVDLLCSPWSPTAVLTYLGWSRPVPSCTADHSFYLDHWCSPTGLDRIKRLFTWDTSCGLVVGLWDNLAAFVSVQWLPQGFSWISDGKVEPTSLTNRAIIGGIIFSGQNKEHPTTPIPVPPWLRGTISSGPTTPCSVWGHCCYMNFSSRRAYSISDLRA